jgi:ribonuclease R
VARKPPPPPTREAVLAFLRDNPGRQVGRREIMRAFGLKAGDRVALRDLLRDLARAGELGHARHRYRLIPEPEIVTLEVTELDLDEELRARPVVWPEGLKVPVILIAPGFAGLPTLGPGDRVLAKLAPLDAETRRATVLRRIEPGPDRLVGRLRIVRGEARIESTDRRHKGEYKVARGALHGALPGDLVVAEPLPAGRVGLPEARILERIGSADAPGAISMIAIQSHAIPVRFPPDAIAEAERAQPPKVDRKNDLRSWPLVTIDGADARDFDDAVHAEPDPKFPGGHLLRIAIADVGWYVRPGGPLDRSARERGNSVYFPDRVVPMLPERLSNDLCSLRPDEDRACLAVEISIDGEGQIRKHRFLRGVMRSVARLTYDEVEAAHQGDPGPKRRIGALVAPLYAAYAALERGRVKRGVLELDLAERRVVLGPDGKVDRIERRARFASHRLIEEFMIAANVAAAETLEAKRTACMYRVHEPPDPAKLEAFAQSMQTLDVGFARGAVRPQHFNRVLARLAGTPHAEMVADLVLRSQSQARYQPHNLGHFGLALARYCHFTSPIRRYADILVHRALIAALGLGEGALAAGADQDFEALGDQLSARERRAASAERDTLDRLAAAWLSERVGGTFEARITGVTRFGLFVTVEQGAATGLIPIRTLPRDWYEHDETQHALVGRESGVAYRLGEAITVRLIEADRLTGGVIFELLPEAGAKRTARPGIKPRRQTFRGRKPRR